MRAGPLLAVAFATVVLLSLEFRWENRLSGALQNEQEASARAWQAQRSRLLKSSQILATRIRVSDSLAAHRSKISVSFPVSKPGILDRTQPEVVPRDTVTSSANLAAVTINDTTYRVHFRVGVEIQRLTNELSAADTLRRLADTVVKVIHDAVPAADTAVKVAAKRAGWFRRALNKGTTVICAAGGAAVGSLAGTKGAVIGAGLGAGICQIAR